MGMMKSSLLPPHLPPTFFSHVIVPPPSQVSVQPFTLPGVFQAAAPQQFDRSMQVKFWASALTAEPTKAA